jgi:hypothetical protein
MCGHRLKVVNHVDGHCFETFCQSCKIPCVVLVNDFVIDEDPLDSAIPTQPKPSELAEKSANA